MKRWTPTSAATHQPSVTAMATIVLMFLMLGMEVSALTNVTVNANDTETDSAVMYTGDDASGGSTCRGRRFGYDNGDGFNFTFAGTSIWLYGTSGASGARVNISIDGSTPTPYDAYRRSGRASCLEPWFNKTDLLDVTHVLSVVRVGANSQSSLTSFMEWTSLQYSVPDPSDTPITLVPTDTSGGSIQTSVPSAEPASSSSSTPIGAIAGGAAGGLVLILAIIAAILLICRQRKKNVAKTVIVPYTEKAGQSPSDGASTPSPWVPPHEDMKRRDDGAYLYYVPPPLLATDGNHSRPSTSSGGKRRESVQSYHYVRNQSPRPESAIANSPSHHYVRRGPSPVPRNVSSGIPTPNVDSSPILNRSSPQLFAGENWDIFGGVNMVQGPLPSEPQSPVSGRASTPSVYSRAESPDPTVGGSTAPMRQGTNGSEEDSRRTPVTPPPPKRSSARPLPAPPL